MERNENGIPMPRTAAQGQCGGANDASLNDKPLAYAYVPIQNWRMMFPTEAALSHGTLFEELYKPMEVYGNE